MMEDLYSRTQLLIGDGVDKLKSAKVLVLGVGGVGGYVVEALARAGVGNIDVLDGDEFSASNLNRQILATIASIGRRKVDVACERIKSINPNCVVKTFDEFYLPETASHIDIGAYDYIVDAIDTVTAKLDVIVRAKAEGVNIISCMGTGNKVGTDFEVADIFSTSVCPLSKVMRKELRARGITSLNVVYSKEEPKKCIVESEQGGRHIPGSISYAPAIAGLTIASKVIGDIISK